MHDICIIGGGASGMVAAITAKRQNPKLDVCIIEKKDGLGKKVLASGNGKCNITNENCIGYEKTLDFFSSIGVMTKVDRGGRVYPYSDEAKEVVASLESALKALNVKILTATSVSDIQKKEIFTIVTDKGIFESKKLLIACGGKAAPLLGATGDGYRWARNFGHRVKTLIPVLSSVETKENVENFAGIREKGCITLKINGGVIFKEEGEIQFTKYGISGICVFNLSRFLLIPQGKTLEDGFDDYKIEIDFLPDKENVLTLLQERQGNEMLNKGTLLRTMVKKPLAQYICEKSGGDLEQMALLLKNFPLTPKRVKGWDFAQCTKGGVDLSQLDCQTMESVLVKNLYFAGEIVDYDGPCGGYNLQNAWHTGIVAGREMSNV